MRPSSNREFENHFRVFPSAVRVDAIRIVFRDSAESFIPCRVLRTARAGRSAEDRLLCKQEALGSNPSRSTPIPYLPRFKSTFRTVPDLGLGSFLPGPAREPWNRAPVRPEGVLTE